MMRTLTPQRDPIRWGASTLATAFSLYCGPAHAQATQRIEVTGHVAPRCWAAPQAEVPSMAPTSSVDAAAMTNTGCTQGAPQLSVRYLNALSDEAEIQPAQPVQAHRPAVEIVVSPLP